MVGHSAIFLRLNNTRPLLTAALLVLAFGVILVVVTIGWASPTRTGGPAEYNPHQTHQQSGEER
jgi:hypothetical protein